MGIGEVITFGNSDSWKVVRRMLDAELWGKTEPVFACEFVGESPLWIRRLTAPDLNKDGTVNLWGRCLAGAKTTADRSRLLNTR